MTDEQYKGNLRNVENCLDTSVKDATVKGRRLIQLALSVALYFVRKELELENFNIQRKYINYVDKYIQLSCEPITKFMEKENDNSKNR